MRQLLGRRALCRASGGRFLPGVRPAAALCQLSDSLGNRWNQQFLARLLWQPEEPMSNQDFPRGAAGNARAHEGVSERTAKAAKDALSSASSFAGEAAGKVKQAASETAAGVTGEVKELLNRQVDGGADTLGQVARSVRRAADDLERESPQIAGLARALASRVDGYADDLRHQSVDQLWQAAADLTRRQPALVFGLAALAGFFALRAVKSSPSLSAPSIQPSHSYNPSRESVSYGA
jgi:hypothetical protein